jgi:hypothetical protein
MFSIAQKRAIADQVQALLRATAHPELPAGEISFLLHVDGAAAWSFADIRNNEAVNDPQANPWNERPADVGRDAQLVAALDAALDEARVTERRMRLEAELRAAMIALQQNPEIVSRLRADELCEARAFLAEAIDALREVYRLAGEDPAVAAACNRVLSQTWARSAP